MKETGNAQEYLCGLAIATVPKQKWGEIYDLKTALRNGTIFKELNMTFFMGGDDIGK